LSLLTMMEFSKGSSGELRLEKRDPTFDNFDGIDFVLQTLVVDDRLITLYPAVVRPSVRPSDLCPSILPSVCPLVLLSVPLSARPSVCPSVSPSDHPSISVSLSVNCYVISAHLYVSFPQNRSLCLSVHLFTCRSVCPSAISQFFCLSNYLLFTHPSTCPSVETSQATLSVHLTVFKSNSEENRSYTTMKSNVV